MTDEDDSLNEETVRKAIDHAQSGAPAAGSAVRERFAVRIHLGTDPSSQHPI